MSRKPKLEPKLLLKNQPLTNMLQKLMPLLVTQMLTLREPDKDQLNKEEALKDQLKFTKNKPRK